MKDTIEKSKQQQKITRQEGSSEIPEELPDQTGGGTLHDPDHPLSEKDKKQFLLKRLELQVDLYKHYLDLIIKFNTLYYAATGAIVSFYISQINVPLIRYILLFPILMSLFFGALFFYAALCLRRSQESIDEMVKGLELSGAPESKILFAMLAISAVLMIVVCGGLCWSFFRGL